MKTLRLLMGMWLALLVMYGTSGIGETTLEVKEPAQAETLVPRKPERSRWSWNLSPSAVTPTGDLQWAPEPFVFEAGSSTRYIDFEHGDDAQDGKSQNSAWKHHPWDSNAVGQAKECRGIQTYIFKRGVIYRGHLIGIESGTEENPIRLTSDPSWGTGEAMIYGSERVSGWKKGAELKGIPEGDKVWYADLDFLPRSLWEVNDDKIERVPLARVPHWKVSDPEDVLSEWWTWEQPQWWTNKWRIKGKAHIGVDTHHLTKEADYYIGAVLRTEYAVVMGTPFPTRVESYDPVSKAITFQGIWGGDSESIWGGNRYYLEDKPQYLDGPGEFWFEKKGNGGRLYLRLTDDRDPNQSTLEVARYLNLIEDQASARMPDRLDILRPTDLEQMETKGLSHVRIAGLTFKFINTYWDLTLPSWMHKDVDNACIRLLGASSDVRIDHCRFECVNQAVRIQPLISGLTVDRVGLTDNEIQYTDHGAISIDGDPCRNIAEIPRSALGDVKVLRNRLYMIGQRPYRQSHDFALCITFAETMEVAGNILERCYGAGLFLMRGKDMQEGNPRDVPLSRSLVYHNRVVNSLLTANDWGGIEVNGGGAAYVYDNISGNANGYWNWSYYNNSSKPNSTRLGMAYYFDGGGSKTYVFNNVAWGLTKDVMSKHCNYCAFYDAGPNIMNSFFNNTVYNFAMGSVWSPAGGRYISLGNVWSDFGSWVYYHGKVKEDKDPPPASEYPLFGDAYGKNIFFNVAPDLAVFEAAGQKHSDLASMNQTLADHKSLSFNVGMLTNVSPFHNAAEHDFRPKAGSALIDNGVRMFVPWALCRTVGEWHFRRNNADPSVLLDDHFYPTSYVAERVAYTHSLLFNLTTTHIGTEDYQPSPLEDWTVCALQFNGKDQFASLSHAEMTKPYTYNVSVGPEKKQVTVKDKELATPDIDTGNLLIEVHFRTQPNRAGNVIVAKLAEAGYQLAVNKTGGVTLTLKSGVEKAELASGARINDGQWHHVIAEVDRAARSATIYVDGQKAATGEIGLTETASLSNASDLFVGRNAEGNFFTGALDFLRIARGTLQDAKTTIEELYDWEFDGPFLRDFAGHDVTGKSRDAGAFEWDKKL